MSDVSQAVVRTAPRWLRSDGCADTLGERTKLRGSANVANSQQFARRGRVTDPRAVLPCLRPSSPVRIRSARSQLARRARSAAVIELNRDRAGKSKRRDATARRDGDRRWCGVVREPPRLELFTAGRASETRIRAGRSQRCSGRSHRPGFPGRSPARRRLHARTSPHQPPQTTCRQIVGVTQLPSPQQSIRPARQPAG